MKTMTQLELDIATIVEMLKKFDKYLAGGKWGFGHIPTCPACIAVDYDCCNCTLVRNIKACTGDEGCLKYIPTGSRIYFEDIDDDDDNYYLSKSRRRRRRRAWIKKAKADFEQLLAELWDEYKEVE